MLGWYSRVLGWYSRVLGLQLCLAPNDHPSHPVSHPIPSHATILQKFAEHDGYTHPSLVRAAAVGAPHPPTAVAAIATAAPAVASTATAADGTLGEPVSLTLSEWLAAWSMTVSLQPSVALRYLSYLGYSSDRPGAGAVVAAPGPRTLRPRKRILAERSIVHALVFGTNGSGKVR